MTIQYPRLKALLFVVLCAAPLIGATLVWYRGESVIPLAAYGVVSVVAFFCTGVTSARRNRRARAFAKISCTPWSSRADGQGR